MRTCCMIVRLPRLMQHVCTFSQRCISKMTSERYVPNQHASNAAEIRRSTPLRSRALVVRDGIGGGKRAARAFNDSKAAKGGR